MEIIGHPPLLPEQRKVRDALDAEMERKAKVIGTEQSFSTSNVELERYRNARVALDSDVKSMSELMRCAVPVSEGGTKHDHEKPRMDLLDPYAVEQLAQVLSFGAQKYAAHNWRQGLGKSRLIAAALRHLFAYLGGHDKDPESGLSHVAHAMCCCMFILGLEHRAELDDRWKEPK